MRPSVVVSAALLVGSCATLPEYLGSRQTKAGEVREPITDPSRSREGSFFRFHELVLAQPYSESAVSQLLEKMKMVDADHLADEYIRSYDGARSAEITVNLVRMAVGQNQAASAIGRIYNVIRMPDGTTATLPIAQAYGIHLGGVRVSAEALRQRGTWPNIGGRYMAEVNGFCPFTAGWVYLNQKDYLVEGTRDGRLLLSGAVGVTRASFIAEEVRYSSRTITDGQLQSISAPDRPSEVYHTSLGGPQLELVGTNFRTCSVILRTAP